MAKNEMKVTSINTLKSYMKGSLVELPGFGPGQEFYARLQRPSMLAMLKDGSIPNQLLESASDLFAEGASSFITNRENAKQMFEVIDKLCEATFVEPTYNEMMDAGIKLTDEQLMFIFNYTQNGVAALDSFREKSEDSNADTNEQDI